MMRHGMEARQGGDAQRLRALAREPGPEGGRQVTLLLAQNEILKVY
jgi:hypothetical protein